MEGSFLLSRQIKNIVLQGATTMLNLNEIGKEERNKGYKMPKKISSEFETYPILKKYFQGRGFMFTRIEGSPSVPDIFVSRDDDWYWVEVKFYQGPKDLWNQDFTADDLSWKPGQLRFRQDVIFRGSKEHYLLIIYNPSGERRVVKGGLDR